jgi:hypothetical protein
MLQAAIIAMVLGVLFRRTPAVAASLVWPYVLAAYGFLAATMPWLLGGRGRDDFALRLSLLMGVFFALPLGVAACWLSVSPYRPISIGCWLLVAVWGIHLLISIGVQLKPPKT